jgi:hypothetical protein
MSRAREKRIIVHDCFCSSPSQSSERGFIKESAAHHRFAMLLKAKEGSGRRGSSLEKKQKNRTTQVRKEMFARRQSRSLLVVVLSRRLEANPGRGSSQEKSASG